MLQELNKKTFTTGTLGWSKFVRVGAIDCAHSSNTALCRRYEVMGYPTIRYFPPHTTDSNFLGIEVMNRKLDSLEDETVKALSQRDDLKHLLTVLNQSKVDWSTVPNNVEKIVKVVNAAELGQELALDLNDVSSIQVVNLIDAGVPTVDISIESRPSAEPLQPVKIVEPSGVLDRRSVLLHLCGQLCSKGYKIPQPADLSVVKHHNIDVTAAVALKQLSMDIKEKLKNHGAANVVFQVDIEGALKNSLNVEIAVHKTIAGEAFDALKNYIKVLEKFFHIGENGKNMLKCINTNLEGGSISGEEFSKLTEKCENQNKPVYQVTNMGWVGCRGSSPTYRGFPCALWTTFHSLTVQQYLKKTGTPLEVLNGIAGYVKHFLGCTSCSYHFQQMAQTISGNVTDGTSGLLWLWAAHNQVNARLAGDATEDPSFPKVQYPESRHCSTCRSDNGSWNKSKVVEYLVRVYDSFTYMTLEDIEPELVSIGPNKMNPSKALRHEFIVDDAQYSERVGVDETRSVYFTLGFGVFDFSLCLVLYVFSMGIIALVCVKIIKSKRLSLKRKGHMLEPFCKA